MFSGIIQAHGKISKLSKSKDFEPPINCSYGTPTRASYSPLHPQKTIPYHPIPHAAGSELRDGIRKYLKIYLQHTFPV